MCRELQRNPNFLRSTYIRPNPSAFLNTSAKLVMYVRSDDVSNCTVHTLYNLLLTKTPAGICALLGYYAALCGNCYGPETSVNNYHTTPRNIPEEHRSHQHRGGSLRSRLRCLQSFV
jgi:hypothetical protein